MFDPDEPFNIHLDPPLTEHPPLVEIKQEGKASYTPLTSILPTSYLLISQYGLQVKIILCPLEIRQQQLAPLYLTQILYSQETFACICGCYICWAPFINLLFINGVAPFSSLKMECPFINRAAPFSSILSCSVYKWSCSIFKQLCQTYNKWI